MSDALFQFTSLLVLGLVFGLKHALDADHVVAVSTLVTHTRSLKKSSSLGMLWGLGHTAVLLLVGLVILILKVSIPNEIALSFEFLVGALLVVLGIDVLRKAGKNSVHLHKHKHGTYEHVHFHSHISDESHIHSHKSFLIGMMHGLAGSAALMLLVLATVTSTFEGLLFISVFGIGSMIGMVITSSIVSLPFMFSSKFDKIQNGLRILAGVVSIVFGSGIVYEVGFLIF